MRRCDSLIGKDVNRARSVKAISCVYKATQRESHCGHGHQPEPIRSVGTSRQGSVPKTHQQVANEAHQEYKNQDDDLYVGLTCNKKK